MKNNSIPKGTCDYYGESAKLRDQIIEIIGEIYKKYGFEPLYTPIIENADVFKGHHGEGEKLLFNLSDKNGEKYVLKYDSTVPLARVVSMHNDIKLPYKRYQFQQSFRDDEIDKGHFREFIQCDGDIVGTNSLVADAEFIEISNEVLKKLGFDDFTIRLNHRKLIKAIAEMNDINDKNGLLSIQRAIDVSDKVNKGNITDIRNELSKTNIEKRIIDTIVNLMKELENTKNVKESIQSISEYFGKNNKNATDAILDLNEILSYVSIDALEHSRIDFTLARGADYYTGFILEAIINNVKLGAVLGGGRYDDLVNAFNAKSIPAVGMAFGLERLIVSLKELGLDKKQLISDNAGMIVYCSMKDSMLAIKLATSLRKKYNTSIIFSEEVPIESLIEYCRYCNIDLVASPDDGGYKLYKPIEIVKKFEKSSIRVRHN